MFNRFMITTATAALIAGTGFAYAQGSMSREGPGGGAGVQQSAPSSPSAGGATSRESSEGMKASQSEEKGGLRNQRAQDTKPGAMGEKSTGEKSAQETGKGDKSKSISSQNEKGAPGKDATGKDKDMRAGDRDRSGNMKAEGREGRDNNMKAEGRREDRDGNMKAEGRDNNPAAESRSQTIGQAGAGAKLSTEQRTRITTIIRNQRVAPATNINFAVSVGTRVPRDIGFHPLPAEIVTIYPEWRGYEFFLVRDEIVVVDPRTLEIVAVLPA
jgi:Protein of unknown function (DUF1236)